MLGRIGEVRLSIYKFKFSVIRNAFPMVVSIRKGSGTAPDVIGLMASSTVRD
jgi:hypothetical protein